MSEQQEHTPEQLDAKTTEQASVRENERMAFIRDLHEAKTELETAISKSNELVNQFFKGYTGDFSAVLPPDSPNVQQYELDPNTLARSPELIHWAKALLAVRKEWAELTNDKAAHTKAKEDLTTERDNISTEITNIKNKGFFSRSLSFFHIEGQEDAIEDINLRIHGEDGRLDRIERESDQLSLRQQEAERKLQDALRAEP